MSMETPKKKIYDEDFRRRFILKYFNPSNPRDSKEMDAYDAVYFDDEEELARLENTETILLYQYVLGDLNELDKESFRRLVLSSPDLKPRLKEIAVLPKEELRRRLKELEE